MVTNIDRYLGEKSDAGDRLRITLRNHARACPAIFEFAEHASVLRLSGALRGDSSKLNDCSTSP